VHELRIYECVSCGQVDCYEVTSGEGAAWTLLQGETLQQILTALKKNGAP